MNYIREHLKGFLGITVLMICTIAFLVSNELIAEMLPDAADLMLSESISEQDGIYQYTGDEIIPEFQELTFYDKSGEYVTVTQDDFVIDACFNNVEMGYGDIEVSLEGYRNSVLVEDAFQIVVGQVQNLEITKSAKKQVTMRWDSAAGADGYVIYRSADKGETFEEVKRYTSDVLEFTDKNLSFNKTYLYQVCAMAEVEGDTQYGETSNELTFVTPLKNVKAEEVEQESSDKLTISWKKVKGAVSYQVFRSESEDGTFEFLGEITDKDSTSYTDENCEIGVEYYYYVVAGQKVGDGVRMGDPSNIVSGSTIPATVNLNGSVNGEKTTAVLKWSSMENVDGYEIYKSSGSGYALYDTVSKSTCSITESGLTAGKRYSYKVRAFKEVNGVKIYGEYSESFTKTEKINYNYTNAQAGDLAGVTNYVDTSYVPGGSSTYGWDCSGFTKWALKTYLGIDIPKGASAQGNSGTSISVSDRSQWEAGDILCYTENGSTISHVALYLGNGQLMHAINEKYDTLIQSVDYYESWDHATTLVRVKRFH